jgi:sialidase-1
LVLDREGIVTSNHTLLAFCEGRKNSRSDTGDIDLLSKRSTDGGKTWSETQLVCYAESTEEPSPATPWPIALSLSAMRLIMSLHGRLGPGWPAWPERRCGCVSH